MRSRVMDTAAGQAKWMKERLGDVELGVLRNERDESRGSRTGNWRESGQRDPKGGSGIRPAFCCLRGPAAGETGSGLPPARISSR